MQTFNKFNSLADAVAQKKIDFSADTFNILLTNTAPVITDAVYTDISANELGAGNGYTTGGAAVASTSLTKTAANSWGVSAATSTAYNLGDIVKPATGNSFLYLCVHAGTSGASAPSWGTTVGDITTDGGVTWLNIGQSIDVFAGNEVVWTANGGSIGPFEYAVLYDVSAANEDLIGWWSYGSALTINDGETFTVKPSNLATTGALLRMW